MNMIRILSYHCHYHSAPLIRLCLFCLYTSTVSTTAATIITADFHADSYSAPEMRTILRTIPAITNRSSSVVDCARRCHLNRWCKYAVFHDINKTCDQIYGLSNEFRQVDENCFNMELEEFTCRVIWKASMEPWTRLDSTEITTVLTNHDHCSELKLKTGFGPRVWYNLISQLNIIDEEGDSKKFIAATYVRDFDMAFSVSTNASFRSPIYSKITFVSGNSAQTSIEAVNVKASNGKASKYRKDFPEATFFWKHLNLESDIILAHNITELIDALLNGYRRLAKRPTVTYVEFSKKEVHFDMTDVADFDPPSFNPNGPHYFESVKELARDSPNGEKYIQKQDIFRDGSLTPEMLTIPNIYPWVLETTWSELTDRHAEQLTDALRRGKQIRMVIDEWTNTDIIVAYVTTNPPNILVCTAPYVHPVLMEEITASPSTAQLWYMIYGLESKILSRCQTESMIGGSVVNTQEKSDVTARWFVSTKEWTELFAIDQTDTVISGTFERLLESVVDGKNIRACVEESSGLFYCLDEQSVLYDSSKDEVLLHSHPFVNPFESFQHSPVECGQQYVKLISSKGWVQSMKLKIGFSDPPFNRMTSVKISWFVEGEGE